MPDPMTHCDVFVKNVSKKFFFNLGDTRKQSFKTALTELFQINKFKPQPETISQKEFWALRNVSFQLSKGETLGIMGLNGSGKSTLLKLINGIILPDTGEIKFRGTIGALIEIGAGFHPMLTGKENIYLKSSLLGKSKVEIDKIFQKIVDFSELDRFINSPIKSYSSGMKMRLGFAVSIFMRPDILLMDEVLAVGDFKFQQKCLDKINELRKNIATIFVSHSTNHISLFCDRVLVLDKGQKKFEGVPKEAIKYYLSEVINSKKKNSIKSPPKKVNFYGELFHNKNKIDDVEHYWADDNLSPTTRFYTNDEANLVIRFTVRYEVKNRIVVGIPIWDAEGNLITGIATDMDDFEINCIKDNTYNLILNLPSWPFNSGEYYSVVAIVDGAEFLYRGLNDVTKSENNRRYFGVFTANHMWRTNDRCSP